MTLVKRDSQIAPLFAAARNVGARLPYYRQHTAFGGSNTFGTLSLEAVRTLRHNSQR